MTKHIVKMECKEPGCKHAHDMEVDFPDPITVPATITQVPQIAATTQVMTPPATVPPKDKKLTHDEMSELIPAGINSMACPGGDCGKRLVNPKQTKKYKSCPNCDANTLVKGTDTCPYCSKNIDADELGDGIEFDEDDED